LHGLEKYLVCKNIPVLCS